MAVAVTGTAANPIVIRAANRVRLDTDGSVRVSGARIKHFVNIQGSNIWLYGLHCDGTDWLEQQFSINLNDAARVTIKRCRIYHWEGRGIQLNGASTEAEIAYCDLSPRSFDDQRPDLSRRPGRPGARTTSAPASAATSPRCAPTSTTTTSTTTRRRVRNTKTIRSRRSFAARARPRATTPPNGTYIHNLFIRCDASAEGVDAPFAEWKAASCTFRENTFQDCDAHLTFRQGINNSLTSNWFKNVRAIRMMDGPHRLIGNVVESCPTGINILAGTLPLTTPQAQKDGFVQAHDVLLAGNRREGSAGAFLRIGSAISGNSTLPALRTRVEGYDSSKGPISYGNHQNTQGPFATTVETWPSAVRLGPADVGLDAP